MPETTTDLLTAYRSDAHSIEEQALAQLRDAPDIAGVNSLKAAFRDHLLETEGHERQIRSLLGGRSAAPSRFEDLLMKLGGKGFVQFARANPDTPGKLLSHALSYEALEEASDELLATVAREAGEPRIVETAEQIGAQEKVMRERLEGCFDAGVESSLAALGDVDLNEQVAAYVADANDWPSESCWRSGARKRSSGASSARRPSCRWRRLESQRGAE